LVSFCISTYKRKDFLRSTLDSFARQTYPNFEVIVSDNDTEESGREVVEERKDGRFRYFANGVNLGMKKSFNKSLERSSGEYIVMIADDDPVYPEMLEILVGLAGQYPGHGLYLGGCNWFCTDPRIAGLYNLKVGMNSMLAQAPVGTVTVYPPTEFLLSFFGRKIFPAYLWSTAMVKRDVLVKMGGTPDYGTPFLGDYAYLSTMGADSGCVVINTALGHQTVHLENFGREQNDQIMKAAVNFTEFVFGKVRHLDGFPAIEKAIHQFVALWAVSHVSFLHNYHRVFHNGSRDEGRRLEKEVFSIPFIKKYRTKYWLKINAPGLHDLIVSIKKKIN